MIEPLISKESTKKEFDNASFILESEKSDKK